MWSLFSFVLEKVAMRDLRYSLSVSIFLFRIKWNVLFFLFFFSPFSWIAMCAHTVHIIWTNVAYELRSYFNNKEFNLFARDWHRLAFTQARVCSIERRTHYNQQLEPCLFIFLDFNFFHFIARNVHRRVSGGDTYISNIHGLRLRLPNIQMSLAQCFPHRNAVSKNVKSMFIQIARLDVSIDEWMECSNMTHRYGVNRQSRRTCQCYCQLWPCIESQRERTCYAIR